MRIFSSFRDYYDGISHQFNDDSVIYKREKELVVDDLFKSINQDYLRYFLKGYFLYSKKINNKLHEKVRFYNLHFCGENIPFLIYSVLDEKGVLLDKKIFYKKDIESLKSLLDNRKLGYFRYDKKEVFSFIEGSGPESNLNQKHSSPIILVDYNNKSIEKDVNLSDLDFFKIRDPFNTHLEIERFISNNLSSDKSDMIKISDKIRAEKHGFDKWSFRKKPENG